MLALGPPGFPAVPRDCSPTVDLDARPRSRGKTLGLRCVDAGLSTHTPPRLEDFAGTGLLVPGGPPLVSGSGASPRLCGVGCLRPPPRGGALALFLAFGCANPWRQHCHLARAGPCPAHTPQLSGAGHRVGSSDWFGGAVGGTRRGLSHYTLLEDKVLAGRHRLQQLRQFVQRRDRGPMLVPRIRIAGLGA